MMTVNKLVQWDEHTGTIPLPRLVLMTRSFEIIHTIPHFTNWRVSLRGSELDEISFEITKYVNGVLNPVWDDLIDLKIVSVECNKSVDNTGHKCGKFEITVSYTDENKTTKSVTGVSLETELGQVMLHDFHVNDDFAMEDERYDITYLYNPSDKPHSLLHRALVDKAPHWKVSTREDRVAKMQYVVPSDTGKPESSATFEREYTVDGTSIYDFLTGDVAKDANIVFRFDTDERELWFESLVDYIPEQGEQAPTVDGIGEDTTILISKAKLGNNISIESNKDNVKNCFRIEGGDDLINSQVAVVNMTGTNYIYHFADFQLADMPEKLRNAILAYEEMLADPSLHDEYYGENGLYTIFAEANEQYYYLRDEMAPDIPVDPPETPEDQWLELKEELEDPDMKIGVLLTTNYDSEHYVGITNNVSAMLEVWSDSRYTIEVLKNPAPTYDATNHIWRGFVRVTRFSDTTKYYPLDVDIEEHPEDYIFTAKIVQDSDADLTYTKQKIEIAKAKGDLSRVDAQINESMTDAEIIEYFSQWNLTKLQSFQTGYDTCKSVLMSGTVLKNGTVHERQIAESLLAEYNRRLNCVNQVITVRQAQVKEQEDIVNKYAGYKDERGEYQKGLIQEFQEDLAFDKFLLEMYPQEGADLYLKYRAYIREDTYQNSNKISDSIETQKDLTDKAMELLEEAQREIKKACVLQRTMTVSINNLMAIPEFKPLYSKFDLFNYIRVRTEDEILKLRLIGIDYSGDSMETIEVTFSDQIESVDGTISDLQSILNQAKSIATTYTAVSEQANQGSSASNYIYDTYRYGLDAANVMLKNSDDNEVTITSAGIIAKRMDDQGFYGDKQLRIIGNGIYMTENAWQTVSMALGEINFEDPITGQISMKYGVIADAIVGKILVGNKLYISNAQENDSATVLINGNGIKITNGTITWGHTQGSSVEPPDSDDINDVHSSTTQSLSTTLTGLDTSIGNLDTFKSQVQGAFSGGDPTTVIGDDYIITPKIGGGYLYITNSAGTAYVEIDPHANRTNNGYMIRAHYGNDDIFTINSSGQAFFSGAITVGSTPSASTTGFTVSSTGLLEASNATIYGIIHATSGQIGGWNVGMSSSDWTNGALYHGSDTSHILLDAYSQRIVSQDGIHKSTLSSGELIFSRGVWNTTTLKYDYSDYLTLGTQYWTGSDPQKWGAALNGSYAAQYLAFGFKKNNIPSDNNYSYKLVLNHGLNPNSQSQDVIVYGTSYFDEDIYAANKIYVDSTYYLSEWLTSGSAVGVGTNGTFCATAGLRVGSTHYTTYTASVHGSFYATNIRADAWGNGRQNTSYNHSLYGTLAVLDNSGSRATITANLSGNCTGSSGSCTGEAANFNNGTLYSTGNTIQTDGRYINLENNSGICGLFDSAFRPNSSYKDTLTLGTSTYYWAGVYSKDGQVHTSDRNKKKDIVSINSKYEDMFMLLNPVSYEFKDGKRTHLGYISQDVEEAMNSVGLTDMEFAGFCKDVSKHEVLDENEQVTDIVEEKDKNGNPVYNYALRYSEFIALNTHMIQKLYKRVEELEAELSELKKQ